MIWFDAALEHHVGAEALRQSLSAILDVERDSVKVVRDVTEMRNNDPVTCLVDLRPGGAFSQIVSIYLTTPIPGGGILDGASHLAKLLQIRLLLADDESQNPYAFILFSTTGLMTAVEVDADELDLNNRYVIVRHKENSADA
jgi:hypothetical protein